MIKYKNNCVGCTSIGLPCMGDACSNKNIRIFTVTDAVKKWILQIKSTAIIFVKNVRAICSTMLRRTKNEQERNE